ncbi:MAG: PfkB family carbohydrate kinase, partial [Hyphomicrobiales bacterium]
KSRFAPVWAAKFHDGPLIVCIFGAAAWPSTRSTWVRVGAEGFVPPFAVTPVSTVAAGDCFNAGLAVALSEGRSLMEAARFASACGALSTTKAGSAAAAPTRTEVERLLGQAAAPILHPFRGQS